MRHQAARAGVDHAERAQGQERRGLHRFTLRGGVAVRRRQRADQPFDQHADNGGRGDVCIKLGQVAAGAGGWLFVDRLNTVAPKVNCVARPCDNIEANHVQ